MNHFVIFVVLVYIISVEGDYDLLEGDNCTDIDGVNGVCVHFLRCWGAEIILEIEHKKPMICSFEGKEPIVCCTDCPKYIRSRDSVPKLRLPKVGDKAYQHCKHYIWTHEYKCRIHISRVNGERKYNETKKCYQPTSYGVPAAAGGFDARRYDYPHMALLGYGEDLDSALWLCAGSIISPRFILTAAHCTHDPRLGPVTFVATGLLKRSDPLIYWKRYSVKRFINHPEYKPPSKYNDIALLETEIKMRFDNSSLPACLPYDDVNDKLAFATGWGTNATRGPLVDILQRVDLEKFKDEECSSFYPPHRLLKNGYHNNTQMCYGHYTEARDTCLGDSGGPLQVGHNDYYCAHTIIGVTSYGKPCGFAGQPGMYTRVEPYLHWIESIVWPGVEESPYRFEYDIDDFKKPLNNE